MNQTSQLGTRSILQVAAPTARPMRAAPAVQAQITAAEMLALWRETIALFSAQCRSVFVYTLIGFAGIGAVTQSFGVLTEKILNSNLWPLVICAGVALPLHALAQGAIAWIGLHSEDGYSVLPLGRTIRVALSCWKGLLPGSLLHAALTFVCALGFTPFILSSSLGAPNQESFYLNPEGIPRLVASHSIDIDVVLLEPLHPLAELLAIARRALLRPAVRVDEAIPLEIRPLFYLPVTPAGSDATMSPLTLSDHLTALVSLVLLIATETLLRFRAVAAIWVDKSPRPAKHVYYAPLIESVQLGLRHFRLVTTSFWVLRLIVSVIQITAIILPVAAVENGVPPQLSWITSTPWIGLVCRLLCAVGGAVVNAVLAAFCALYDARLFVALQQAEQGK